MELVLNEDKFHIRTYFASCACACRFCCLGKFDRCKQISFDDYETVLRKFADIGVLYNMRLRSFIYNCVEHPYLSQSIALYNSLEMEPAEYTQVDLNGTIPRFGNDLCQWFDGLQQSGVRSVAFSWFGMAEVHNRFVRKNAYYEYLVECAKEARRRGLPVISKVFLHQGIIPDIDRLISTLEAFSTTIVCALMEYSGYAKKMESEFLCRKDMAKLPISAKKYLSKEYCDKFFSEAEWLQMVYNDSIPRFKIVDYVLYLNSDNIDYVKKSSVEQLIQDFRFLNTKLSSDIPSISALAQQYGNESCSVLYEFRDMLRKWLDQYYIAQNKNIGELFSFTSNSVEWKVYERL